jgi:hypothetical protein
MTDEIIQEVWQAKDRLAREFNYDMDALAADLRKRQKDSGRKVVNLADHGQPPRGCCPATPNTRDS